MSLVGRVIVLITAAGVGGHSMDLFGAIDGLPRCARPAASSPESWQVINPGESGTTLKIPTGSVRLKPEGVCVHGCESWSRDSLRIGVVHGAFGAESFSSDEWMKACQSERHGLRRVEIHDPQDRTLTVWPLPRVGQDRTGTISTKDFVVRVSWETASEAADALRVVDSLQRVVP